MDNYEQINLFEETIPYYKITKPIRLIEMFAGIGSQHQALKKLGINVDRSTIVEWSVYSIQAYNDIHIRKYDDHTQGLTKDDLVQRLSTYGVSLNYNEPAKPEQLARKGEEWLRNLYNNIINTNNKVNIMSVKGKDLEIVETDKYDYILTYSFPCQDLSKAGKGKGMSDTSTRSGLLWEVERILSELDEKPQVLLMENVPDVVGTKYINDFKRWDERLRELGYTNHIEILNAKDYGVPQNRERAFMVSVLGNYLYKFPRPKKLELRLKDVLEHDVDDSYYLTDEKLQAISQWKAQQDPIETMEKVEKSGIAPTLTARGAGEDHSGMILVKEFPNYVTWEDDKGRINTQDHRAWFDHKISGTIPAIERGVPNVLLSEVVKVGNYMPSNHNASSIIDPNGIAPTVMENHGTITAIVEPNKKQELANKLATSGVVSGGEIINHSYTTSEYRTELKDYIETTDGTSPTLTTRPDILGYVENHNQTIRIRKLTPRECYRLMGFDDVAFDRAREHQSNSSLYHQAGDSIVVDVLENIFKGLL